MTRISNLGGSGGSGGGGSTTLAALTDVTITSPANLDILSYSTASSKWINRTASGLGLLTGPAGSNTQFQFNDGGVLAGASGVTYTKSTQAVVIGGNLNVGGNTNTIQLTVVGNSGQGVDLQEWQDSSNNVLSFMASNGKLTLPSGGLVVGTNQLVVKTAGIGVGLTNPLYPIHVSKNSAGGDVNAVIENTSSSAGSFAEFDVGCQVVSAGGVGYIHNYCFGSGWATTGRFVTQSGLIDVDSVLANGLGIAAGSSTGSIRFYTGGDNERARFQASNGNLGLGVTTVNAVLHIKAGTAAANTAPLLFTSGTSLTTAIAGAVEFTTDDLFFTITTGAARKAFILDDGTRLTSGRVPFATTNGRLIDSTNMTFVTDTLTVAKVVGSTSVKAGSVAGFISSDGSTGATGSFLSADAKTITVKDGIITSIV